MPKERNYNPVAAQRKADKAKDIRKGKAEATAARNERLAKKNPERIRKQIEDYNKITGGGGKLTSHDTQVLEGLEKELKAVTKAREALGERAPTFGRTGGGPDRGHGHGDVLGKRRRYDGEESSTDDDVPEDVRSIPLPRDTPPPIPKEILDKWYAKRRAKRNANKEPLGESRGKGRGNGHDETGQEAASANPRTTLAKPQAKPVEVKAVYEAKPVLRDLHKEAVTAFVPAVVQRKLDKIRGKGGTLLEPEEADRLEKEGYLHPSGSALTASQVSFTFILPLFPSLLEFYRQKPTQLSTVFDYLNAYKASFARPIDSRYDVVLLGGALGSLFSILQAIASPVIGHLSDRHGRRTALLASMAGNIMSVLLWVMAVDFRTFVLSRVVGGLSEGNVQMAMAIATDISDDASRGSTMALIGVCFSVAFTFGPALGAWLSSIDTFKANPFAIAAGFSLCLIVTETVYLYNYLPETLPDKTEKAADKKLAGNDESEKDGKWAEQKSPSPTVTRTNSHFVLNLVHFAFLLFFSGMEFSLPFMTFDLFGYGSAKNGRLLGFVGLVASVLQGGVTRRLPPLLSIRIGVLSCLAAFLLLGSLTTTVILYLAAACLAATSATVVTGLNALSSFEAHSSERGSKLGALRSWGQVGRALGPILFTTVYWWAGRTVAYGAGAIGITAVGALVFFALKSPTQSQDPRKKTQ
ncbi:tetracycline transporter [Grosmannia clavigera kw1407]|uniref:Tetracycline transporter n=1 Tax=Grosmannia clavigera (strain kw1407 / UAMH 11150) TaxID=655863 RepID=F0XJY4_GROCL|nr:tetracycline transporter [Grosmannia clavigera kw1407]EFX01885.1 tetracycline transporter [Grosmannia clavigera kw1407]